MFAPSLVHRFERLDKVLSKTQDKFQVGFSETEQTKRSSLPESFPQGGRIRRFLF